ncbi:uncharacterized protein [Pyxicephalus adspersus]|uniref:uncharacterized protein n=1 Tax=Pyxicephalus adspersus TaxID=30357 RepID=UPI003B5BD44F
MPDRRSCSRTMICKRYDQQRSIFVKRQIAEWIADRLWTSEGRRPTVIQIQHTWSDLKRRRPDLVCEVGDRILSANTPSRRLIILQRPHRLLAIPQDVEEEQVPSPGEEEPSPGEGETSLGEEEPSSVEEEPTQVEEEPSPVEEKSSPEEETAAPHPQPESSDEGEEAAEAEELACKLTLESIFVTYVEIQHILTLLSPFFITNFTFAVS